MKLILYTTHCPQCKIIEQKLQKAGLEYIENTNIQTMHELGIKSVPVLEVDGILKGFVETNKWLNSLLGGNH